MNDTLQMKGEATFYFCDVSTPEAKAMEAKLATLRGKEFDALKEVFHSKFLKRKIVKTNIIPTVGRTVFAMILAGTTTYTGILNYCALGSDATGSANGNTQLGTEVFRKVISSKTYSSNVAYISTFFTATETTGTYYEVGHFIDGTGTVNTGQLFSRIADPETAELPLTKSNTESLTVDYKVTIS